jgi:UDP-glucose 4-epimerase
LVKILVTGIRGFIGAALAWAADARGHEVVGVDQSARGRALPTRVHAIEGDITQPAGWREALEGVDVVIHSAAMHHTDRIAEAPIRSIEVNLRGTRLMLAEAAASKAKRFVHLSSAKVYGEPLGIPSSEDDLVNPLEPYGMAKVVSEQYCRHYAAQFSMRCISVRPFSVYGPRQDLSTGYVGQLIEAWLSGRPALLSGSPHFVRDLVHVDDVVDICLAGADDDCDVDVVNVGSGSATRLKDLVAEFARLVGDGIDVQYSPARPGTIQRTHADVVRMSSLLGRSPIPLHAGLLETIEWFGKANRGAA